MKQLFAVTAILCMILCGCSSQELSPPPSSEPPTFWEEVEMKMEENDKALQEAQGREDNVKRDQFFEKVCSDTVYGFEIYRDIRTDVMYLYSHVFRGCAITVMLSADGSPLLYSEWIQMGVANG